MARQMVHIHREILHIIVGVDDPVHPVQSVKSLLFSDGLGGKLIAPVVAIGVRHQMLPRIVIVMKQLFLQCETPGTEPF